MLRDEVASAWVEATGEKGAEDEIGQSTESHVLDDKEVEGDLRNYIEDKDAVGWQ